MIERLQILDSFITKIWTNSGQLNLEPWWYPWVFRLLSKAKMMRKLLLYDLHKCYELQSSSSIWKSDSCLEICWNWTFFLYLTKQSWKTYFHNLSSHKKISCFIVQSMISLDLVKWIKMLTVLQQIIWKEKENEVNKEDLRSYNTQL